MFDQEYLENQRLWLLARKESKIRILKEGGEQALLHSQKDIIRIDFALKRIEQGQYGLCCNCGVPIESARLMFQPETPFCAYCQTQVIAKHNHTRN